MIGRSFNRNNSFVSIKFLSALLAVALVLGACDTNNPQEQVDNTQVLQDVQQVRSTYSASLSHLGDHLKAQGTTIRDRPAVENGLLDFAEKKYGADSKRYKLVAESINRPMSALAAGAVGDDLGTGDDLSAKVQAVALKTDRAVQVSANYHDLQGRLQGVEDEVMNKSWSKEDKVAALIYVAVTNESLGYFQSNPDLLGQDVSGAAVLSANSSMGLWGWIKGKAKCIVGTVAGGLSGYAGSDGDIVATIAGALSGAVSSGCFD